MVLNMLTTVSMIKWGKTYGNLMVDVRTGSEKLKDRAKRIVGVVTGLEPDAAEALLKRSRWNVKAAIVMAEGQPDAAPGDETPAPGRQPRPRSDRRGYRAPASRAPRYLARPRRVRRA
jgi:N-acetylmuramic acid 6-phosphate etherase